MNGFTGFANLYQLDVVASKPSGLSKIAVNEIRDKLNDAGNIAL